VPFAGSLTVRLYVASEHREAALEIVNSINQGDLIGEQWNDAPHPDSVDIEPDYQTLPVQPAGASGDAQAAAAAEPYEEAALPPPQETRVSPVSIAIVAVIVVALLYYFGR
jgi:hypothetical protein